MPRRARIHLTSLRSSLVNLPISLYGPLLERGVRPQHLAVHLALVHPDGTRNATTTEAYVGWTGMPSASSLAQLNVPNASQEAYETLEIDPQYAASLGFHQDSIVEIGLLHDLSVAKSVATEPVSSDDWEIIELHAAHIESTLLSQVRVASIGQEINVWVLGRTRVRLTVVSFSAEDKSRAQLLSTDTEVSIAPKLHRRSKQRRDTKPAASIAKEEEERSGQKPLESGLVLRVLPWRFVPVSIPILKAQHLIAYISPHTYTKLTKDKHPLSEDTCRKVKIVKLERPIDPEASSDLPASPMPKVLNPGHAEGPSTRASVDSYVAINSSIPNMQIVFPELGENLEEWGRVLVKPETQTMNLPEVEAHEPPRLSPMPPLEGVDTVVQRSIDFVRHCFAVQAMTVIPRGVPGLLVTGRAGAGKSSVAKYVAESLQRDINTLTYTLNVDVSRFSEKPIPSLVLLFQYWIDKALYHKPTVIILDNLEKLASAEVEHADSFRARHITELFLTLFSSSAKFLQVNFSGVVLLATASSPTAVHSSLNTSHVFKEVVNVPPPNKEARKKILERIAHDTVSIADHLQMDPETPPNFATLANQTEGYLPMDLRDLVSRAAHQVAIKKVENPHQPNFLDSTAFRIAQRDFVPLSLRDVKIHHSDVAWEDIGGLKEVKKTLRETLEWPTKYAQIFSQSPLRLRSGLLLYGYPGCGKTLLASAVAKECGLNFISVKGPEILNKYIGASEKSVRDLFERASAAKPCVLFFDEFDSIAPKRGHDSTGVTDRVVNQMLTQMDGAEGLEGVYVLAATSRPDLIDSALLRPGRLDKAILCNMPDVEEREEILRAVSRKVNIADDVSLKEVAEATEGFSGADLQALLYNAHLEGVHSSLKHIEDTSSSDQTDHPLEFVLLGEGEDRVSSRADQIALERRLRKIQQNAAPRRMAGPSVPSASTAPGARHPITQQLMRQTLSTSQPSVSVAERSRLDRVYQSFLSEREGKPPVPSEDASVGTRASLM